LLGFGPKLPLSRDAEHGIYTLTTSYSEQIQQNFKNLLLTAPGERIMNPDFGVGLRHFLFEQKTTAIPSIRQRIKEQVRKYLPFIEITSITFDRDQEESFSRDSLMLSLSVAYTVPSINLNSSIILSSDGINKL
jgi:hypothetical protein